MEHSLLHQFLLLLPLILFLLSLWFYLCHHSFSQKKPTKTGFKTFPIIGVLPEFLKKRHCFLDWTTEVLTSCPTNTAVFHCPGLVRGIITANPSNVEYMLKTNFDNFPKGEWFNMHVDDFLGRGFFNSDGELWRVQRETASYEFNTKSLRTFVMESVEVEISTRLVPILSRAAETKQVVDLKELLDRFVFDNMCKFAFAVDPGCLVGNGTNACELMRAFEDSSALSLERFLYPFQGLWKFKRFFNIGSERTLRRSIKIVHDFADEIIRSRIEQRAGSKTGEDLLSRFIANYDISAEFLRSIVINFILAGKDTTSLALSWFFWLLSLNPDVERNILKELETIRTPSGKNIGETFSSEELRNMHYLQAAISESMRLYPPIPVDTRSCKSDDVLPDGTVIGKGWFMSYHTYAMGRMESIWDKNCCEFRPERWLENGLYKQESPFKFPVFHVGPRMCLGKEMAYMQMKSIAALVIGRFKIDARNKEKCPENLVPLTLMMKGGLQVNVRKRCVEVIT